MANQEPGLTVITVPSLNPEFENQTKKIFDMLNESKAIPLLNNELNAKFDQIADCCKFLSGCTDDEIKYFMAKATDLPSDLSVMVCSLIGFVLGAKIKQDTG